MAPCGIAGGCRHPTQLSNHSCRNGCARWIHSTCAFEVLGLEGQWRCTKEGACWVAGSSATVDMKMSVQGIAIDGDVPPLPISDAPTPSGTVEVMAGGKRSVRNVVQPPGGGKIGAQAPSPIWIHMIQFTPPVSVGVLKKNVKCTVQVGQPGHLRDCGTLHTYNSKQGPSNLIRHLKDAHAKEHAEIDRLSARMARASKEADILCPGEKIGTFFFGCILLAPAAWPKLARFVARYVPMEATSCEAERNFSALSLLMDDRRCTLLPATVEKCMLLRLNRSLLPGFAKLAALQEQRQGNCQKIVALIRDTLAAHAATAAVALKQLAACGAAAAGSIAAGGDGSAAAAAASAAAAAASADANAAAGEAWM